MRSRAQADISATALTGSSLYFFATVQVLAEQHLLLLGGEVGLRRAATAGDEDLRQCAAEKAEGKRQKAESRKAEGRNQNTVAKRG